MKIGVASKDDFECRILSIRGSIQKIIDRNGITQRAVAEHAGVCQSTVSRALAGRRYPGIAVMRKVLEGAHAARDTARTKRKAVVS